MAGRLVVMSVGSLVVVGSTQVAGYHVRTGVKLWMTEIGIG